MKTQTGTIKFFDKVKGYGFIKSDDGLEYFTHVTGCNTKELTSGDNVCFELTENKKGKIAVEVTKL